MPFKSGRGRARELSDGVLARLPPSALLLAGAIVLIAAVGALVWSALAVPADTVEGARGQMRLSAIATAMCAGALLLGALALLAARARVRVRDLERRRRLTVVRGGIREAPAPAQRDRVLKFEDNGQVTARSDCPAPGGAD